MANRKISDLTALTAPATGDLLPIVDISEAAAADKNKKITYGELLSSAPAGSAAAPSFSFDGDPNTGIFNPAADTLAFAEGGSEAMRIDSNGNVGIRTTSPAASLDIAGNQLFSAVNPQIQFNGGGPIIRLPSANTLTFLSDSTNERARITSAGFVGIGTSAPATPLEVSSAGVTQIRAVTTDATGGSIAGLLLDQQGTGASSFIVRAGGGYTVLGSTTNTPVLFFVNSTERARLDASGRLLVGTTSISGVNSNTAPVLAGNFASFTGSTSTLTNTATTLFSLENLDATYFVTVLFSGAGNANSYHAVYMIGTVKDNSRVIQAVRAGTNLTLSLSAADVQATQTSGVALTLKWSVTRIANL